MLLSMQANYFVKIKNEAIRYPVTAGIISVAVVLFLAIQIHRQLDPDAEVSRIWGAVVPLVVVGLEDLNGPLELWGGQWWRIPISGFHHGGLLHLVMNCLGIAYMGRLLELQMNRFVYLLFFLTATTLSMLPEFLMDHFAVGLSGGAYAMFGCLMILRKKDEQIAEVFNESVVQFGLFWLFGCILLTAFEIMNIANAAHFVGFGYGWIFGNIFYGSWSVSLSRRWVFYASHLLFIPTFYFVMHPYWIGRYHWNLARLEFRFSKKYEHMQSAVAYDPSLRGPWLFLASYQFDEGDRLLGWKTVLEGLSYNRSDEKSVELSREIWSKLQTPAEKRTALKILGEVFQDEELIWQKRLGFLASNQEVAEQEQPKDSKTTNTGLPLSNFPSDLEEQDLSAPAVDPKSPESAVEGVGT